MGGPGIRDKRHSVVDQLGRLTVRRFRTLSRPASGGLRKLMDAE
jgi:hypothetical protein